MTFAVEREILNRQTEFCTEILKKKGRLLSSSKNRGVYGIKLEQK